MVNLYTGQIYRPRQIIIGHAVVADSLSAVGVELNLGQFRISKPFPAEDKLLCSLLIRLLKLGKFRKTDYHTFTACPLANVSESRHNTQTKYRWWRTKINFNVLYF